MTSHRQHRMFGLAVLEMYNALKDAIDFRTFFNISVNWRRLAEPTQPVWWIDTLTTDEFEEGLALETPLVRLLARIYCWIVINSICRLHKTLK